MNSSLLEIGAASGLSSVGSGFDNTDGGGGSTGDPLLDAVSGYCFGIPS